MTARRLNGIWYVKIGTQEVFGSTLGECTSKLKKRSQGAIGA